MMSLMTIASFVFLGDSSPYPVSTFRNFTIHAAVGATYFTEAGDAYAAIDEQGAQFRLFSKNTTLSCVAQVKLMRCHPIRKQTLKSPKRVTVYDSSTDKATCTLPLPRVTAAAFSPKCVEQPRPKARVRNRVLHLLPLRTLTFAHSTCKHAAGAPSS
eukprot:1195791-Prorocentrum_minimum.AAC.8